MSILIGADIVPTSANKHLFNSGDMEQIVGEKLFSLLKKVDYRIFNLECPIVDVASPIKKCGSTLKADTKVVNGLASIGVDLLTLANNHIMDHDVAGLMSTIESLKKANIAFLGAGENIFVAEKPFLFEWNGKKIGVYACAEHEFSIADEKNPGANPFDSLESFDHVSNLKKKCDYAIVLYHGGKEHYRYPSPMLRKVCKKFVQKGADLVVCQHSHCIGCYEKYGQGTIVYGQGNFIFNTCNRSIEQTSLLVELDDNLDISFVPLVKYDNGVRLAEGRIAEQIISDFNQRSNQIKEDGFIEREYARFAQDKINVYLLTSSGYGHKYFQRMLNKLFGYRLSNFLAKKFYNKKELLTIQNCLECEAHRELWIKGLKDGV